MRKLLVTVSVLATVVLGCGDDDDTVAGDSLTTTSSDAGSTTEAPGATTTSGAPSGLDPVQETAVRAYVEALGWTDQSVLAPGDEPESVTVISGFGERLRGTATVAMVDGEWVVDQFFSDGDELGETASVSLGQGHDRVTFDWVAAEQPPDEEGLGGPDARLRITYGEQRDQVFEAWGEGRATWEFDLGPLDTATRFVEVALVDRHDNVAHEVWAVTVPAGEFAAG